METQTIINQLRQKGIELLILALTLEGGDGARDAETARTYTTTDDERYMAMDRLINGL